MRRVEELYLIIGMMLVTYLARYPPLAIVGRVNLPGWAASSCGARSSLDRRRQDRWDLRDMAYADTDRTYPR